MIKEVQQVLMLISIMTDFFSATFKINIFHNMTY